MFHIVGNFGLDDAESENCLIKHVGTLALKTQCLQTVDSFELHLLHRKMENGKWVNLALQTQSLGALGFAAHVCIGTD